MTNGDKSTQPPTAVLLTGGMLVAYALGLLLPVASALSLGFGGVLGLLFFASLPGVAIVGIGLILGKRWAAVGACGFVLVGFAAAAAGLPYIHGIGDLILTLLVTFVPVATAVTLLRYRRIVF